MKNIKKLNKSKIIINILCNYIGDDFEKVFAKKENKYLLLLLLKNYKCLNREEIKLIFSINTDKSINYHLKKAEEKFLINRDFREFYLTVEKYLEEVI